MRWRFFMLLMLVMPTVAAEPIYRQTDEHGRPVFTDQPAAGAEPVDLSPANTTPAVAPSHDDPLLEQTEFSGYRVVEISEPMAIVPNGLAKITVAVRLEPELQSGHRLRVLLDGEIIARSEQPSVVVGQLPRGSHTLEVQLVEGRPERVVASARRDISVYWPGGNR